MSTRSVIHQAITIPATADKVWQVFTDATVTREIGGEYISDWTVGSSFGWKGLDGKLYTHGRVLEIQPLRMLKHNLSDMNDESRVLSIITYTFEESEGQTTLVATEELNYEISDEQLDAANEGWYLALRSVKELAEKL